MIRRLFLKLFRRRRLQQDLEAELAFHREMAAAGGNPIPLGNTGVIREHAYDLWRFNFLENLWRDLVLAVRALSRSRGLVIAALLSLGLGIGVNTAMFSLTMEFLLSEPSVRDAASLVYIQQGGNSHVNPEVVDELRRSDAFEDVVGENEETFINFNNGSDTRRIFAVQGTRNFFSLLGVPLAQGRGWNVTDSADVVVLHPHFWRTNLGADPAIIGKQIRLDGRLYTVLGILPDTYRSLLGYGFAPDVFIPTFTQGTNLRAYARMKPRTTVGQLNAELPAIGERLDREFPSVEHMNKQFHATAVSGIARLQQEKSAQTVGVFFVILLVIVGLVLLIACVNVAGLLLARASARRQEIAIRLALGASRPRLLQQLLAESLLLSLLGAAVGFLFAILAAKAITSIPLPVPVPIRLRIDPDWRVACYAGLLAIVSAVASGLVPAWQSVTESLSAGMRRERKLRMRRALIVAQLAVSFIVLTTAALFLQNLARSSSLGPGFDIRHTVRAEAYLPPSQYKERHSINLYIKRSLDNLRTIPGVNSVAAACIIPFTDSTTFGTAITFPDTGEKTQTQFNWNGVTPGYFEAMAIPLLKGRDFVDRDNGDSRVVIVNDEFVRHYLGNREPVGTTFQWGDNKSSYQIVGVARATKNMTIGEDARAQLYEPFAQIRNSQPRIQFVIRSATPPAAQVAAVQDTLRRIEPAAGLEAETMFSAIGFAFLPSQVGAALMGGIGLLGLLLVIIGLYGVLAYSVTRRTREIGIRIAIGASPANISAVVLREFAQLLTAGIAIGLTLTLFVTRPLSMFFVPGLRPNNLASLAGVIAVLGITGVLAALGPVRRALRVDPTRCLRYE